VGEISELSATEEKGYLTLSNSKSMNRRSFFLPKKSSSESSQTERATDRPGGRHVYPKLLTEFEAWSTQIIK
jgi:hypothetical protein